MNTLRSEARKRRRELGVLEAKMEQLRGEIAAVPAAPASQGPRDVREQLVMRANERKFNNLERFYKMQSEAARRQGRQPPD
jgi:hypothetical protein